MRMFMAFVLLLIISAPTYAQERFGSERPNNTWHPPRGLTTDGLNRGEMNWLRQDQLDLDQDVPRTAAPPPPPMGYEPPHVHHAPCHQEWDQVLQRPVERCD